ncbi:MAG: hypothetical protein NXI04_17985 [Planctomycetaceae bacterium]|nr:hypothetical protein [Planctomycetaceae bacterium]
MTDRQPAGRPPVIRRLSNDQQRVGSSAARTASTTGHSASRRTIAHCL